MAAILDAILKIIAFPMWGFWGTFSMLLMISNTTQIRWKTFCSNLLGVKTVYWPDYQSQAGAAGVAPPPLRITVRTDLPPALKAARGKLANEAYKLKKEKGLSTKIVVREANVVLLWKEKGSTSWNKFVD